MAWLDLNYLQPTETWMHKLDRCESQELVSWEFGDPPNDSWWSFALIVVVVGDSQALNTSWHNYDNVWHQIAYNSYLGCTRQPFERQKVPANWRGWPNVDLAVEHATRVPEEPLRFSRLLSEVLSKMKQDEARVKYKVLHPTSMLLWMEEILHQLIDGLSHYLWGFNHPRWCRISPINSINPDLFFVNWLGWAGLAASAGVPHCGPRG